MKITSVPFGQVDSQPVNLFTLESDQGVTVKITNYGGIVTSTVVPVSGTDVAGWKVSQTMLPSLS